MMKNKFFGIIFALAALPIFANEANNNGELLAHLKNIRAELISILDWNKANWFSPEVSQEFLDRHDFFDRMLHDFYNEAKTLQVIVREEIIRPEFNLVCDNIGLSFVQIQNKFDSLSTYQRREVMISVEGDFRSQDPVEISDDIKQELLEIFTIIFEKHYKTGHIYFRDDFQESPDENIKAIFEEFLDVVIWNPEMLMYDWPMIGLLDEKIAELEAQL